MPVARETRPLHTAWFALLPSWSTCWCALSSIQTMLSLILPQRSGCMRLIVLWMVRTLSAMRNYLRETLIAVCWNIGTGGRCIDVPRLDSPSFAIDIEGIERAVQENNPKIVFLTSPNNPDGSLLPSSALDRLLNLPVLVVLDEAYIEFSNPGTSRIGDVLKHDNLIVLRTFSKRAALAGTKQEFHRLMLAVIYCFIIQAWESVMVHFQKES